MAPKSVIDLTIPLSKYCVVPPNATLAQAVFNIFNSYCDSKGRFCNRARPRVVFIVNDDGVLEGTLSLSTILRILVPEITGKVSDRLGLLGTSVAFAEAGAEWLDESKASFFARVKKNAETRVCDIMERVKARIQWDSNLFQALELFFETDQDTIPVYKENRLIGIIRDYDVFVEVTRFFGI